MKSSFTLSHKAENSFLAAAYWSKGDYALRTPAGTTYAVRGKDKNKRGERVAHPTFVLLDNLLAGSDDFPADLAYTRRGIMKVGLYLQAQASKGGFGDLKHLRPGDGLPEREYPARYNNTHCPLADAKTYLRRRDRKKVHRDEEVPFCERYGPLGTARVLRQMLEDKLGRVRTVSASAEAPCLK
jgi:hypothetical protein